MRFTKVVAGIAILAFASQAFAQDGTLRRPKTMAHSGAEEPNVVIINKSEAAADANAAGTATQAAQPQPVYQPTTVVTAPPVTESRAETLRKARQDAEVGTEQKIVEKLEESRLREERERAERLFGDRFDPPPPPPPQPQAQPKPEPQPVIVAPVVTPPPEDEKPAQPTVNIERVEIVQPPPPPAEPVGQSHMEVEEAEEEEASPSRLYVSGILAMPEYGANNVKSNGGFGFGVGSLINERWAVEGNFLYSNHYIDTFWQPNIYRDLDQYDIGVGGKYYILTGKLRPWLGASVTYIYRKYDDRIQTGEAWYVNRYTTSEETHAVNGGLGLGADFAVTDAFSIGGGLDYSWNIMNRNDFNFRSYGLPPNTKALEEIDYYTLKLSGKMTF
ncbi:MAG: porin family protein [Bdellovibrionales bacterium]